MASKAKRVRKAETGFVGISLVKDGDMTLFNRLEQVVKSNPELSRSSVIRAALNEYLDKYFVK